MSRRTSNRPTGVFKRIPRLGNNVPNIQARFAAISKAQWAELYRDLYDQTHGGYADSAPFMEDAEKRLMTLKANGLAGG